MVCFTEKLFILYHDFEPETVKDLGNLGTIVDMPYTTSTSLALGTSKTGLTIVAQLVDIDGANVGSQITDGFTEMGSGFYLWKSTFPDGFRGGVQFFSAADLTKLLAFAAINPEEAEVIDSIASQSNRTNISIRVGNSGGDAAGAKIIVRQPEGQLKISTGVRRV